MRNTGFSTVNILFVALLGTALWYIVEALYTRQQSSQPSISEENLPRSILHYAKCREGGGSEAVCLPWNGVLCYLEEEYKAFWQERQAEGYAFFAKAAYENGDSLEIYRTSEEGRFFVAVTGPDKLGREETCIVAEGDKLYTQAMLESMASVSAALAGEIAPAEELPLLVPEEKEEPVLSDPPGNAPLPETQ